MSVASVSVIIPVGRVDELFELQLDRLSAQDYTGEWEIVASLNADDELQRRALQSLAGRHERLTLRVVDSSDRRSASHARNVGARSAEGTLLAFCDGDDEAEPGWLSALVAATSDAPAVGGFLAEERLAVPGQEHWRPPATPGQLPSFLGFPYLVSANMAVERALFDEVGGFDVGLVRGEDMAISFDFIRTGADLGFAPDAVIHYRHRKGLRPMLHQHYLYGRGMSQILARHGLPGAEAGGASMLKANGQAPTKRSVVHYLRRGSIAAGRIVGIVEERLRKPDAVDAVVGPPESEAHVVERQVEVER